MGKTKQDTAATARQRFRVAENHIPGAGGFVIVQEQQEGPMLYAGRDLTFRYHRTHCPFASRDEAVSVLGLHLKAMADAVEKQQWVVRTVAVDIPLAPAEDRHDVMRIFPRFDIDQTRAVESVFRALKQTGMRLSNGHPVENYADAARWVFEQIAAKLQPDKQV